MAFDIKNVNGFGTGALGDVTITTPCQVNSYANVTAINGVGYQLAIGTPSVGAFGGFVAGQEIFFHGTGCLTSETADSGKNGYATILAVSGNTLSLDKPVPVVSLAKYVCQIATVPQFGNLTVNCSLSALAFDVANKYGGILIVKTKGTLNLTSGMLLAEGKGLPKESSLKPAGIVIANSALTTNLVMNTGNGIVISINNTLTLSASSRIGASWSGYGGAGYNPAVGGTGGNGPAGFGGGGGSSGAEAAGGGTSTASSTTSTGVAGASYVGHVGGAGGLPGYSGSRSSNNTLGANAGATVMVLANTIINFVMNVFSTGGAGSSAVYYSGAGGGGGAGYGLIGTNTAIPTNSIAYALDTLYISKTSLLTSSAPLDLTTWTTVDNISIIGTQPANTDRRFAFKTATTWQKIVNNSGTLTLTDLPTQAITLTSILTEGNTAAELTALSNITVLVGKKVLPAVAIMGPGDLNVIPTVKLTISGKSNQDTVTQTFDSGEISLAKTDVNIFSAAAQVNLVGSAQAQIMIATKQNNVLSNFVPLDQAKTLRGSTMVLRAICTVPSIASGAKAQVDQVTVRHRSNDAAVSGQSAEIVMLTEDFSAGLPTGSTVGMRSVHALLKHDGFKDATAKAFCAFRSQPKTRDKISLGVGNNGNRLTLILGIKDSTGTVQRDPGINHNTLQIWFGSQAAFDFDFNTEVSELYVSPPDGITVFASYGYGWEPEIWVQMPEGITLPYRDTNSFATDYSYILPSGQSKAVSAVKFELDKPIGSLPSGYSLGVANGKQQQFYIPHHLRRETIQITTTTGSVVWVYDDDSQILTLIGTAGATMTIAADWTAETPVSTGIVAAWAQ